MAKIVAGDPFSIECFAPGTINLTFIALYVKEPRWPSICLNQQDLERGIGSKGFAPATAIGMPAQKERIVNLPDELLVQRRGACVST